MTFLNPTSTRDQRNKCFQLFLQIQCNTWQVNVSIEKCLHRHSLKGSTETCSPWMKYTCFVLPFSVENLLNGFYSSRWLPSLFESCFNGRCCETRKEHITVFKQNPRLQVSYWKVHLKINICANMTTLRLSLLACTLYCWQCSLTSDWWYGAVEAKCTESKLYCSVFTKSLNLKFENFRLLFGRLP